MEQTIVQSVQQMVDNKIALYKDLLHCFKQERNALIHIDLDKLWCISKDKEQICGQIYAVRQKIDSAVDPLMKKKADRHDDRIMSDLNQMLDLIPKESKPVFHNLFLELDRLKREIKNFKKENMDFINDSLKFLDEMVGIITGAENATGTGAYNNKAGLNNQYGSNVFLRREA